MDFEVLHPSVNKRVDSAAKRSRLGVLAMGNPPRGPIQSFMSSTAMNKIFGDSAPLDIELMAIANTKNLRLL